MRWNRLDYQTQGEHVLVDAWGVEFEKLNSLVALTDEMIQGAKESGANVLSVQNHKFEPNGVTILLLLSESHFSIHTYPEKGFAGIDCYTCGSDVNPMKAVDRLIRFLQPTKTSATLIGRGTDNGIEKLI